MFPEMRRNPQPRLIPSTARSSACSPSYRIAVAVTVAVGSVATMLRAKRR